MTQTHTLKDVKLRQVMEKIPEVLTPDLVKPRYRGREHPLIGHCYHASEALYYLIGGKALGIKPMVGKDENGETHWWLQTPEGMILDITAEQYIERGIDPPYGNGRGCGFLTDKPSKRAQAVIKRVQEALRKHERIHQR